MLTQFSRTELLLGKEAMNKLEDAHIAVFGIGGVGGYVCEALARSGVGKLDLIDNDKVCMSNLNRQIIATRKTVGQYKTEVMKDRILDINPEAEVNIHNCFFLPDNADELDIPIISSMGAGNKLDASAFRVTDIYKTKVCPLAKVMRRELKKRGVKKLKVVYSEEEPIRPLEDTSDNCNVEETCQENLEYKAAKRRSTPGSVAFVPSVAGLIIAGEVIKDLAKCK